MKKSQFKLFAVVLTFIILALCLALVSFASDEEVKYAVQSKPTYHVSYGYTFSDAVQDEIGKVVNAYGETILGSSRISFNEIDALLYFRDGSDNPDEMIKDALLMRECDRSNIPTATNIATAEAIITALDRGDLDWREFLNPKSEYNRSKRRA